MSKLIYFLCSFYMLQAMEPDPRAIAGPSRASCNAPEFLITERQPDNEGRCSVGVQTPWEMIFTDPSIMRFKSNLRQSLEKKERELLSRNGVKTTNIEQSSINKKISSLSLLPSV